MCTNSLSWWRGQHVKLPSSVRTPNLRSLMPYRNIHTSMYRVKSGPTLEKVIKGSEKGFSKGGHSCASRPSTNTLLCVRSEWWLQTAWTQDFFKCKFHRSIDLYLKIFAMVWRGKKPLMSYRTVVEVISAHISWGKLSRHCIPNLTVQGAEPSPSCSHPATRRRALRHSLRWRPGDLPAGKPPYKVFPAICQWVNFRSLSLLT